MMNFQEQLKAIDMDQQYCLQQDQLAYQVELQQQWAKARRKQQEQFLAIQVFASEEEIRRLAAIKKKFVIEAKLATQAPKLEIPSIKWGMPSNEPPESL